MEGSTTDYSNSTESSGAASVKVVLLFKTQPFFTLRYWRGVQLVAGKYLLKNKLLANKFKYHSLPRSDKGPLVFI